VDVARMIIKEAKGGYIEFYPAEIAQPQQVNIDIDPMRKLGYIPKVSMKEGIKNMIEFYKKNE
jgi:nucleoside-diphosphate-sugar epimerase